MHSSTCKRICNLLLLLLVGITTLKILFTGYDIDEQYAVSMSYRLLKGDFPVLDLWEPHQTSGFLSALLMIPYQAICKSTDGIVLFLRVCGLILHSLVTFLLFGQLSRFRSRKNSLLLSILFFFSLPKLMFLPEFSNMQIWFLMLLLFCLLRYYESNQAGSLWWLAGAGIFQALEVLSYPSTLLVFLVCIYFIIRFRGKHPLFHELSAFITPCFLGGAGFVGLLLSRMSLSELFTSLGQVASDGSHSASIASRLLSNISSLCEISLYFALYGGIALLLCLLITKCSRQSHSTKLSLQLWCRLLLLCTLIGQFLIWCFGNSYPNYPMVEYFFVGIWGIASLILSCLHSRQLPTAWSLWVVLPLTAFLGIVLFTNHPLLVSAPFLIPAVIGSLAVFLPSSESVKASRSVGLPLQFLLLFWIIVLLFGKCYLLRTTGGEHYTLADPISLIRSGPAMGILADTPTVVRCRDNLALVTETLPEGSKVFYAGCYNDLYLYTDLVYCTPSTISSPTFDEKVALYFTLHPDKAPEYILCDSDLPDLYKDGWLCSYLEETCEEVPAASNDFLLIYRTKQ